MAKLKKYSETMDTSADAASGSYYMGDLPPAGTYNGVVKFIKVKVNKNGDDMLNVLVEVREPKSSDKAQYNGAGIWNNMNVTGQGVPYIKQFMQALGADPQAFFDGVGSQTSDDPPQLVAIGKFKLNGANPIRCATKRTTYNNQERLEVTRWAPAEDAEPDDDDDVEVIEDDADVEAEAAEVESDEDEGDEESEGYTADELAALSLTQLKAIAKDNGWPVAAYKSLSKDALISALLGDDDDEDEPPF